MNYNGSHETALGGGIMVHDAVSDGNHSFIQVDENGKWNIGPALYASQLTLPNYTPSSSQDSYGDAGDITWDDSYAYIKTNNGWKRANLESF